MDAHRSLVDVLSHFVHKRLIWLLVGSYVAAGLCPSLGIWIRNVSFGEATVLQARVQVSLPMLMLALLLFNAGLGVHVHQLRSLLRKPLVLILGLLANSLVPVVFTLGVGVMVRCWHNPDEKESILVGLALVAAMPVAGSSTAWSQNANGNLALSLGMVLFSTLFSPWTTPLALRSVSMMTTGGFATALRELAFSTALPFLLLFVLLPVVFGIVAQPALGQVKIASTKSHLKLANFAILLLLNYSNASVSLPSSVADPDWDFLALTMGIVVSLCAFSFSAGWWVARCLRLGKAERVALAFGLGMNNNGTGLVLASLVFADYPRVMLPIIFYNLIQHLAAGVVDRLCDWEPNQARALTAARA